MTYCTYKLSLWKMFEMPPFSSFLDDSYRRITRFDPGTSVELPSLDG